MELGNAERNNLGLKDNSLKYNTVEFVNENEESSHAKVVKAIKNSTKVLDIGCSNGLVGEYLFKNKKCEMYGCDIDENSLNICKKRNCYKKIFKIDLNDAKQFEKYIKEETFDYIIMADVLEHLINPEQAIVEISKYLKNDGELLVSVPNISHGDIILNLINEKFNYSKIGLLDDTHLRFFTKQSFIDFIQNINNNNNLNFECELIDRVVIKDIESHKKNKNIIDLIKFEDFDVLQYIFKLRKRNEFVYNNDNNTNSNIDMIIKRINEKKVMNYEQLNYEKKKNYILSEKINKLTEENINLKKHLNFQIEEKEKIKSNYNHKIYKIASIIRNVLMKILPYNSMVYKLVFNVCKIIKIILKKIYKFLITIIKLFAKIILPKKIKRKIIFKIQNNSNLCKLIGWDFDENNTKINIDECDYDIEKIKQIDKKIAVHLHLYYIDLSDEFVNYLKNIPYPFDIYISISNKKNKRYVYNKFKKIINAKKIIIRESLNSGRDYGPMFALFGNDLKKYDYILHIHSKKSLRTGKEQDGWRHHLLDSMLLNKNRVIDIISIMEKFKIGIVFQEPYYEQPYWCHTWLGSASLARDICSKLNIEFRDEYLDFSAGSMFWVKTESVKELFELNLGWDDFGIEQNLDDGTLAYVFERIFVLLSRKNNYDFAVYDDKCQKFICNKYSKNLEVYKNYTQKSMFDYLNEHKIVTFDIFDTLITRKIYDPDDIYIIMNQILVNDGIVLNKKLIEIRKEAENVARKKLNKDVNIYEIYQEFGSIAQIDITTCNKIMNLEIDLEIELCVPRKDMLKIYNDLLEQNKQIFLISDMYLTKDIIEKMLNKCGYYNYYELIVSCEINKRKDTGTMWDYFYNKCNKVESVHVGDNEESDIHKVCCMNKKSFHVLSSKKMFQLSNYFYKPNNDDEKLLLGLIVNNGLFNSPFSFNKELSLYNVGYSVLGPIFLKFIIWLNEISKNYDEILFFSREGYYLEKIFNLINNSKISTKYFLTSRRAITVTNIKTKDDILKILSTNYDGSLKNLFYNRLGIYLKDEEDIEIKCPQQLNICEKYVDKYFLDILNNSNLEKDNYLKYINDNFKDYQNKKILAVDLGYSGTVQYELSKLLNKKIDGAYFIVSDNIKPLSLGCKVFSCFNDIIYDDSFLNNPLGKYSLILESFLTSPEGQLLSFDKNGLPNYLFESNKEKTIQLLDSIYLGIKSFIEDYFKINNKNIEDINLNNELILHIYNEFMKNANFSEEMHKVFKVEDLYCSNAIINVLDIV